MVLNNALRIVKKKQLFLSQKALINTINIIRQELKVKKMSLNGVMAHQQNDDMKKM